MICRDCCVNVNERSVRRQPAGMLQEQVCVGMQDRSQYLGSAGTWRAQENMWHARVEPEAPDSGQVTSAAFSCMLPVETTETGTVTSY